MSINEKNPYYSLNKVHYLAKNYKVEMLGKAPETALNDFGWHLSEIVKAMAKLRRKDHYKRAYKYLSGGSVKVDYYKAWGLMGENVYTHFRIEDETLFICSFKRI